MVSELWSNPGSAASSSLCLSQVCHSSGYFELQILLVENRGGQLLNGECCDTVDGAVRGSCGPDECDTYFRFCLKEYQQDLKTGGQCHYGSEVTKVIGGNSFQFKGSQKGGHEAGKIVIPFQFSWPVSGALILQLLLMQNVSLWRWWEIRLLSPLFYRGSKSRLSSVAFGRRTSSVCCLNRLMNVSGS